MTKNKRPILYTILLLLVLGFIWGQSCAGAKKSTGESRFVTEHIVQPAVRAVAGERAADFFTDELVRKLAHVAEYTVLGFILGLLLRNKKPRFWLTVLLGLAVAFLDETVQIFTGRGSALVDIWIDLIGVTLGGLVSLLFKKKRRSGKGDIYADR